MKEREKIPKYCSVVLFLLGANFFVRRQLLVVLRTFFRLCFVVYAIINLKLMSDVWKKKGFSLSFVAEITFSSVRYIFFLVLVGRTKRIESFVLNCMTLVSSQHISKLWQRVFTINIVVIAVQATDFFVIRVPRIITKKDPIDIIGITFGDLTVSAFMITCGFYTIMILILSARIHSTISIIERRFIDGVGIVKHKFSHIHRDVREFEALFSILPLCWFANCVVETPRTILAILKYMSDFRSALSVVLWVSNVTLCPLFVCLLVSSIKSKLDDALDDLYHKVVTSNQLPGTEKLLFRIELKTLKRISFTGSGFFTIDKSFVLSLIGAVSTISVLIATYARQE